MIFPASFFRKFWPVPAIILSLLSGENLLAQTCSNQEFDAQNITFHDEALPIELSGFFPYVLNGSTPVTKYTTEQWTGTGMYLNPACGFYSSGTDFLWAGSWVFSTEDFTDLSSKSVAYISSTAGAVVFNNLKIGLGEQENITPPVTSLTKTNRAALYPNPPSYGSCVFAYLWGNTDANESLNTDFTIGMAKARGETFKVVTDNGDALQYWNNNYPATEDEAKQFSRTAPILCHANRVSFKAQFCQPCLGGGKFLVTYYYKKWDIGQAEPSTFETATDEVEFKDPPFVVPQSGFKDYKFELKQGEQCKLVRVTARKMCEQGEPGDGKGANHSVDMLYHLGKRPNGSAAGGLEVRSDIVTSALYSPAALQFIASDNPDVIAVKANGALRQVKAPETTVDIVTLTPDSYELRFYPPSQTGAPDSVTGIFALSGQPYVTHLIENPDAAQSGATNRIRFTETRDGTQKITLYDYDSATGTMTMTSGNGLRAESLQKVIAGDYVSETRTIKDAANQVVSVTQETKKQFGFGLNVTQRVLDPAGAALTTSYSYYEDYPADGQNYGQVKLMTEPSGRWTRYTYDSLGRPAETVTQFLDSSAGSPASQNRVISTTWGTLTDIDGDGLSEKLSTTVDSLLGQETGRSFEVIYSKPQTFNGQTVEVRASIRAVASGAAWDASENLVTLTRTIQGGALNLKPMSTLSPDQVLTLYQYDSAASTLTTTTWHGQPNVAKDAVVSGTKTVTTEDLFGNLQVSTTSDIATSLLLSAHTVSTADAFGRPTRLDYDDGTFELRSYACCGLDSTTDRTGLTTSYVYDALGRVTNTTQSGITIIHGLDPEGRLLSVSRQGSDDSVSILQTNTYDLAGRPFTTKDALSRTTTFSETINGSGQTVKTTTMPDLGIRVETYAKDGSLLTVTGNAAAQQLSYAYGVDADGPFTKTIHLGQSGETTEWTKSYTDFPGRSYKIVQADSATTQSYFNPIGQLVRQTDADGVATLFAYNARGEQETTALDVNCNGIIDFDGTDRITKTTNIVAAKTAGATYTVQRSTAQVWEVDGQDTPTTVSLSEQSTDGLHSWQTTRGPTGLNLTTTSITVLDGAGDRTVTTTGPDGVKSIQVYSGGVLVSTTTRTAANAQLASVSYGYDPHHRLQTTTDARTGTTTYSYYADDQIHTVTTPDPDLARTGDGYDPQTTTYTYNSAGRVDTVTQPDNTVVSTTYWPTGAVKRTWGSRTYPTEYTYDPQGRVKTLTTWQDFTGDAGKAVTAWNYDAQRGFLLNKHYADNKGPSYTYWPSGRLHTRTWARTPVVTTTYDYNTAGDLSSIDYSDSTPDVIMDYDRLGRPKTRADAAGLCTWSYDTATGQLKDEDYTAGPLNSLGLHRTFDSLNRLDSVAVPSVSSMGYSYDAASRLGTVTSGARTATYGYVANSPFVGTITFKDSGTTRLTTTKTFDNLNRLSSITNSLSVSSVFSAAYNYNSANQRMKATREDNVFWNFDYDALGQVTSGKKHLADATPINGFDYALTYDDIGNRKTATTNSQVANYTPNNLNEYSQRTVPGAVDVVGTAALDALVTVNGLSTQRQGTDWYLNLPYPNAYDPAWLDLSIKGVRAGAGPGGTDAVAIGTRHIWLPKSPEVYLYDSDGNLSSDGRWSYTWDAENRLSAIETRSDLLVPVGMFPLSRHHRLEFLYDGQGRRISKKVFNWTPSGWLLASHTLFLHDGWNLLAELNALNSNAVISTYVWGSDLSGSIQAAGGVGGLLFSNVGTATHASAFDGNGNVIGLVDMATGIKSATYDYNAFGETIQSDGVASVANHFRFSTKYTDDETGLLYYGLRYYNPSTGRWINRDPIEEQGGVNLYGFVGNDPIGFVDPHGLVVLQGMLGVPLVIRITLEVDWETDSKCCRHVKIAGEAEAGLGAGIGARFGKVINAQVGIMLIGVGRKQEIDFVVCPDGTGHVEADLQLLNISKFLSQGLGIGHKRIGIEAGVSFDLDLEVSASVHIIATSSAANVTGHVSGFVEASGGAGISLGDFSLGSSHSKELGREEFDKILFDTTVHFQ